jgi:hypothetical protein
MHPVRTLATIARVARGRFFRANVDVPARPRSFEFALLLYQQTVPLGGVVYSFGLLTCWAQ